MVEPQGRRLARVVARLRPCRLRESCRSEDEADARGRLEVLTCDARIAVRREVCWQAFVRKRGPIDCSPATVAPRRQACCRAASHPCPCAMKHQSLTSDFQSALLVLTFTVPSFESISADGGDGNLAHGCPRARTGRQRGRVHAECPQSGRPIASCSALRPPRRSPSAARAKRPPS